MKKYYLVGKGVIDEILIGRVNFLIWRFRLILSVLTMYFLWTALLAKQPVIGGYTASFMLTYIFLAFLVSSFVLNSRSFSIGDDIQQGNLSNYLLKPYNYFLALFSSDMAEKGINVLFAIGEIGILFFILKPPIFLQTNIVLIFFTTIALIGAILIYFMCGLIIGSIGFWSHEVWGPRFIFTVGITVLSGLLFPIDMLPKFLFSIAQFSPFTYLIYFPVKVYLGQLAFHQILFGTGISLGWVIILYYFATVVWRKGLMRYTAEGR